MGVLVSMLEDFAGDIAELMFVPGLRRRVDVAEGANWAEVLQSAHAKFDGKVSELPTSPEQDDWVYNTTRNGKKAEGPQRMCDALVCSICKAADPDNELCQISGKYTMHLRTPMYWFNEREL